MLIIPKDALIVSKEDGEILGEVIKGDKIVTAKTIEAIRTKYSKEASKPDGWQPVYVESLRKVESKLSDGAEKQIFHYITGFVRRNTNKLAYKNGKPITANSISAQTGISLHRVRKVLTVLVKQEIIKKKDKAYYMNPYIIWSGKYMEKETTEMFKDTEFAQEIRALVK